MGPVNFIKGYGMVVNPVEDDLSFSKRKAARKRRLAIAVSLAVLLTVAVGAVLGIVIRDSNSEDGDSHPISSNSTGLLSAVCAVTQHPDSCFVSMSPFPDPPKPDPEHFLNVSLRVAINELANVSSLPKSLISKVNGDHGDESALQDCEDLFDNAVSQLNESAGLMVASSGGVVLTPMKISSLQTWISAAMTDQDTCLNGLEEMNSTVIGEVKARVQKSNEYMSNTLAILTNLQSLHEKFGVPKH